MRTKISKQIASIAALTAVIATTTFAQSEPVYSVNVIGMQKQPVVENLQMMSNPFEAMTIKDLVGNSGVSGNTEGIADNVIVYDSSIQNYRTYFLRSANSPTGVPEWRAPAIGSTPAFWATNIFIQPQEGFFYRSRASVVRTNVVVGDVVMAPSVTNTIQPGLQLLSYPYSVPVKLSDLSLNNGVFGNTEGVSDNIIVYDSSIANYRTYFLRSANSPTGSPEWRAAAQGSNPAFWATNVVIDVGQGFFFRSRAVGPYLWVEQSPYPDI